jgi:DDE_Tnp_1-associated
VTAGFQGQRIIGGRARLTGITLVLEAAMVPFAGLLAALEQIPDPRRRQGRRYPLAHLLLFSVLAVLAGATSYRGILVFIAVHRERLNAVFGTTLRRAPAVNTLRALFQALDPIALEAAFRQHARELSEAAPAPEARVIALDGKNLKRSFDHLHDRAAAHVLSAFACEAAVILAHQEVRGAPEEVPAAQALIEALGVHGVLFTADALHGQKKPSRARRAPATPFWFGSRPTSRACMTPS